MTITISQPECLTASDILAMPADAYMNAAQLAFFHARLQDMLDALGEQATSTGEHLRDTEESADPNDRATQEELQALELRTRERERKLQRKIEAAIKRIDHGTYGYCEESGEPIGIARLLARPTATLSLEAQDRHEKRERLFKK